MTTAAGSILVLFDIDGTLVLTGGAGVRGLNVAFTRLHGVPVALDGVPVAGRTDRAILDDVFARTALDANDGRMAAIRDAYLDALPAELTRPSAGAFGVLPGVHETLDTLEQDDRFTLALLTGNFARGAEIKLRHFDLWHRFAFGAYGDDHANRRDLVPVAVRRAIESGRPPREVVVIGDTPLDIDCARAYGARAVAVATGHHTVDELIAAGADLVVDTLESLLPANSRLAGLCEGR